MTDTMSAVSGESFRAELQRSALAARQAWTRQLEPMLSRIHESCLEAANVGLESIEVDLGEFLWEFRPGTLGRLCVEKFKRLYVRAVWGQLRARVQEELEKMGLDSDDLSLHQNPVLEISWKIEVSEMEDKGHLNPSPSSPVLPALGPQLRPDSEDEEPLELLHAGSSESLGPELRTGRQQGSGRSQR